MKVEIDGVEYFKLTPLEKEARQIMMDVYHTLWSEAYSDPFNDLTKKLAMPLADKMKRLNEIIGFSK